MFEGERPPRATPHDALAIRVHNALSNGMGGIDWHGIELIAELYGAGDLERLIEAVIVVKEHRPPDVTKPSPPED